jgi:hypothetical protein
MFDQLPEPPLHEIRLKNKIQALRRQTRIMARQLAYYREKARGFEDLYTQELSLSQELMQFLIGSRGRVRAARTAGRNRRDGPGVGDTPQAAVPGL